MFSETQYKKAKRTSFLYFTLYIVVLHCYYTATTPVLATGVKATERRNRSIFAEL